MPWALYLIDPRLPPKVRKDYEHRLGDVTYLSDLHSSIFQAVPSMLKDLDKQVSIRALTSKVDLKAFNPTGFADGCRGRGRSAGSGGRGRAVSGGRAGQGGRRRSSGAERPWYDRFCKVCQLAGKPVHVHTSHNTVDCKPLYTSLRSIYFDDDDKVYKEEGDDQVGFDESVQADSGPLGFLTDRQHCRAWGCQILP